MATNLESCFHLNHHRPRLLHRQLHRLPRGSALLQLHRCRRTEPADDRSRSLAAEWARDKIRANCVAPGMIMTDMVKGQEDSRIPTRRIGEPEDVYVHRRPSYVTGQVVRVDGGRTISA
ncbi:hypothetical protein SETIT_8G216700v2 [Setaria italica]|uniref:Uncharacterized protein n=1 Tax=Setaria italica TaxID=4555 RepID=A0A368SAF7_SETIT|nr:hypothetical protein SETIT_8G216700v2 [Setaria italica]